jgi:hypothetical protein
MIFRVMHINYQENHQTTILITLSIYCFFKKFFITFQFHVLHDFWIHAYFTLIHNILYSMLPIENNCEL